jgi:hypothetical protein
MSAQVALFLSSLALAVMVLGGIGGAIFGALRLLKR